MFFNTVLFYTLKLTRLINYPRCPFTGWCFFFYNKNKTNVRGHHGLVSHFGYKVIVLAQAIIPNAIAAFSNLAARLAVTSQAINVRAKERMGKKGKKRNNDYVH